MLRATEVLQEDREAVWGRHRGPITSVALVPGTSLAVTAGYDSAVALFDLRNGSVELLGYHDHLVNRVVVNADGTRAATCSSDYSVCIWDLASRTRERLLLAHSDDVEDFVFVDDGTGVSASRDRRILVWNLRTGAVRRVLHGHERDVLSVAYSGGRVYSSGDDATLRVWDLDSGRQLQSWGPFETETDTCAIDPVRQRALLGCDDGRIRVFDVVSGASTGTIDAHASGIKKIALSPVTGHILSAAYDQKIVVWNAATFERTLALEPRPATWERSLTWSPDGRYIVGGSFDGTVLLWDAATGAFQRELGSSAGDHGNACFNDVAAFGPGEVVTVSDDGIIRMGILSAADARWTARTYPVTDRILMNAVTCDPSGLVVGGSHDHALRVFRRAADTLVHETDVHLGQGPINSVRIAHHPGFQSDVFAGCYSSQIVRVSPDGRVRGTIHVHDGAVKSLRLHPTKPVGVSCGADGRLLSWTFDGRLLQRYLGHNAIINDLCLDPDGQRLASVARDFTVKVFEVDTGRLQHSIPIGRRSLKSVCFWDATTLMVGDYWGAIIRVDLSSETIERQTVAANGISAIARTADGVVAASYDGGVYLVDRDLRVVRSLRAMRQKE